MLGGCWRFRTAGFWATGVAYAPCSTLDCRIRALGIYSAPVGVWPSFLQCHMRRLSKCVVLSSAVWSDHDALILVNSVHPSIVFSKLFCFIE